MQFSGIYTPVITPFHDDGSIDEGGFAQVVEFLVDAGVHGIVVAGTTGEYYAQTTAERVGLMQAAHGVINGRVPLMVGVGAIRTEDAIELAQAAKQTGADALLVNSPPYVLPTESENAAHALAIDQAAGLPIMLYNYPGRTGVNMGEEYLRLVSASKNFCAIKESSGDINRLHLLANDYPNIQLSCGADDQALEFFVWGARSWVCAGGNFAPEAHIALYQACVVNQDFEQGRKIMAAMLPLLAILEQGGKFGQCIKYASALRGLPAGPPRNPLAPLTEQEQHDLAQVIEKMNADIKALMG
ncbi:MAG TPA: dihydrodipicolinate synthase family protein [Gammaproteobacteria bacterium]|jgi:4-hydroxy-tetrahydrodipicolinate synthase|nr:dihydrodipicolinate synthase family protein [Arenicellales bacterium]MDP7192933.1 dihydrodipicolinate synthase family protein [Arenicellales bacterium]MDP7490363.1 dihydrodipicolinate synthase family protein [Arenicellales bacterium]MDP7569681.1 dihydrodipicolinate synthase family protein [Arenicellales bacterium]HCV21795.1 dihydrodipicolinate synthase family protein [Gammaproteobacteria bacterium]|tara:strand:+ start:574 stop:1473 length:900 start_codon:yes stop_codon:yes gene_type:complete